ncbi:MAG TPA: cobalt ECF transporter T component CbiQ [Ilumatobacteraceae bacterium]|nr:cobalt ECF transporter T component CbiQ [Ilumatobacteraceae bacterium]
MHRLSSQCKLLATFLFVLVVVSTPRETFWAFGVEAGLLGVVAVASRVPFATLLRRLTFELPFVAFAMLLPIVGRGERVGVAGVSLSVSGLWAAWNILVKGTLGVAATGLLTATTPIPSILQGLERLRLPKVFVAICAFMVRYADVIAGELHRMRVARESRGHDPRWIWQARAVAATAGALFIRSYERGERVYLAMVARGYYGSMPVLHHHRATRAEWAMALSLPAAAAAVSVTAWLV